MLRISLQRNIGFAIIVCSVAACSSDSSPASVDGGAGSVDAMHNPPNPAGLGPAPVELGASTDLTAAGSYVILAKTGITNVTGSSITGGHLGLSPAAASFITGFALIADPSNMFSTSGSVVTPGKIYASNYAVPSPSNLTTAVLGMQAAYTDAAGRTNPDFKNLASGNLGGLTLTPGLYTWGSTVTIPTDVTIAGAATDVWIFQISNDLDLSAAKHVVLSGGAQASNIYWQVAGKVTLHATSHFEGVVLSKTGITLQTTASLHGRVLAQSLVALDNNAITAP
jgi:ice-binding like protein